MNVSDVSLNETLQDNSHLLQRLNDNTVQLNFIPSLILTISMIIIGVPGNILIIVVYMKRWRKSTCRIFILALAFNDLFNCLFTMPLELYFILNVYQTDLPYLCKISRFMTFWTNDGSSLILMGIAVDRLQRICRPFRLQLSISTAKKIVAASMFVSLLVAWPALLIYGISSIRLPISENNMIYAKLCLYADNPGVKLDPTVFVFFIMAGNSVLDVFFLVVYGIILYNVKNSGKELRKLSRVDLYLGNGTRKTSKANSEDQNGSYKTNKLRSVSNTEFRKRSLAETITDDQYNSSRNHVNQGPIKRFHSEQCLTAEAKRKLFAQSRQKLHSFSSGRGSRRHIYQSRDHHRKAKTTIMLFSVTVLFMVSFVPYTVLMTIRNFDSGYYNRLSDLEKAIYQFFIRSYFLSNALNPLIYGYISEHFRTESKSVLKTLLRIKG